MGIALAGVGGYSEFLDTILTLGKHEEFTLYSAVAISNLVDDSERILWSLAKSVQGWGRIHLVERLQHTTNTDIKEWILREGYKNSIMYEYLAPIAAKTGELHNALRREEYDYELLLSASDIIEALIMEGPVVGISEYEHPKEVINRYLELTNKAMKDLAFLSTYNCIKSYLEDLELDESTRKQGWNEESIAKALSIVTVCIENPEWIEFVNEKLMSPHDTEQWKVDRACRILNISNKEVLWDRLKKDSSDSGHWFRLIESYGDLIDNEILDFARETLPLKSMCSGARNELGLGKEFSNYRILSFILQALRDRDGLGRDFVINGLFSPVTNNRNMATNVIETWSDFKNDNELISVLESALNQEVNEKVAERLSNLLSNSVVKS